MKNQESRISDPAGLALCFLVSGPMFIFIVIWVLYYAFEAIQGLFH